MFLSPAWGQSFTAILNEPGFPHPEGAEVASATLRKAFPGAQFVTATQLSAALDSSSTRLLVLPYGSAYPEPAWPSILRYLDRGGNLIVLGGKPFTRAAYRTPDGWHLRAPSVASLSELFIADYQQTPASAGLHFEPNSDLAPALPAFAWRRAFSPVIRLSVTPISTDIGTSGSSDAALTTLAWGSDGAHHRAAPAFVVDHLQHRFNGGRWIMLACEPEPGAFDSPDLLAALNTLVLRRADRFTFRPRSPLFLPGESLEFHQEFAAGAAALPGDQLRIRVHADEGGQPLELTLDAHAAQPFILPPAAASGRGLHRVDTTLLRSGQPVATAHSAFWLRDPDYLRTGSRLGVGPDYFTLDGKPLPVVGTTYMASDVDRLYLVEPNAVVWDHDMAQIRAAGLNMIRTGIWTGWSQLTRPDGTPTEDTLRTIEAYLMTARRHGLPVQFNLFAFLPDCFGGVNALLDPSALAAQDRFVRTLATRFHDVPFLAWDLINEPSANKNIWRTVPQNDEFEQAAWRQWIHARYPDQAALLAAWSEASFGVGRALQGHPTNTPPTVAAEDPFALPDAGAGDPDGNRAGSNPLKAHDYALFTQDIFTQWTLRQRATIRAAGSTQLITVGQDEGGTGGRVAPAFFLPSVDFTADHTWWDFDAILWASLAAKFPGKPMLIQEMGEQRRLVLDGQLRLTADEESWQLERKLAMSFVQGAGGLEWVWNVNARMANDNETTIGAIRPDGTEKPEADVLAGFASFVASSPASFTRIESPQVALLVSQAEQYSPLAGLALNAQKQALRALAYLDHTPARMVFENHIADVDHARLAILPAAQALGEPAWQHLLGWVERGGTLLVTGPIERDDHLNLVARLDQLNAPELGHQLLPLATRQSAVRLPGGEAISLSYPAQVQQLPLDILRFDNGNSVQQISRGQGHILWVADPVELAEGPGPAAALYAWALGQAGVAPAYRQLQPLSPGVLALPTVLPEAVLYSFSSESFDPAEVDLEDALTHARIHFRLPPQRGAMLLLHRPDGKPLASYGIQMLK